jgi:hypothetical protein
MLCQSKVKLIAVVMLGSTRLLPNRQEVVIIHYSQCRAAHHSDLFVQSLTL